MPLNPKDSPADIMHELKKTRKSTKNPSRKSAKKHGTEHAQDVAIMLRTKGVPPKKDAKRVASRAKKK